MSNQLTKLFSRSTNPAAAARVLDAALDKPLNEIARAARVSQSFALGTMAAARAYGVGNVQVTACDGSRFYLFDN